jgi:hypothetical protein
MNPHVHNNWSMFIKGLTIFSVVNLSNYTQNLMKHIVNLDTY